MSTSNIEFLEDYGAPKARLNVGLALLGNVDVPENIADTAKWVDAKKYKINISETSRPYIVSELQNLVYKSLEDLGALIHVIDKNGDYCIDYINVGTEGVGQVGTVYKNIIDKPDFNREELIKLLRFDMAKIKKCAEEVLGEKVTEEAINETMDTLTASILEYAELWHHQSDDLIEPSKDFIDSWDKNALYIAAYIGDESSIDDKVKKGIVKTNKAFYNKTKHRFCRVTKEIISALDKEAVSDMRVIKIELNDDSIKALIQSLTNITYACDVVGSFHLHSIK